MTATATTGTNIQRLPGDFRIACTVSDGLSHCAQVRAYETTKNPNPPRND